MKVRKNTYILEVDALFVKERRRLPTDSLDLVVKLVHNGLTMLFSAQNIGRSLIHSFIKEIMYTSQLLLPVILYLYLLWTFRKEGWLTCINPDVPESCTILALHEKGISSMQCQGCKMANALNGGMVFPNPGKMEEVGKLMGYRASE